MKQCTVQVHRRLAPVLGAGQAHHGVTKSWACSVPSPAPHNRQLEMGNPARDGTRENSYRPLSEYCLSCAQQDQINVTGHCLLYTPPALPKTLSQKFTFSCSKQLHGEPFPSHMLHFILCCLRKPLASFPVTGHIYQPSPNTALTAADPFLHSTTGPGHFRSARLHFLPQGQSHRAMEGNSSLLWGCAIPLAFTQAQQVRDTANRGTVVVPSPLLPRGEMLASHICSARDPERAVFQVM